LKKRAEWLPNGRGRAGHYHILDYQPITDDEYKVLVNELKEKISKYSCKIVIVTNFYRYFCPCHITSGWLGLQRRCNGELAALEDIERKIFVLKHFLLVDSHQSKRKASRDIEYYTSLQYDNLHFPDYHVIARNVCDFVSKIQS
jgi:hypothetical protein